MSDRAEFIKAILIYYKRISRLLTRYDSLIEKAVMRSYNTSCEEAVNCVMGLMERKTKLVNLKSCIDTVTAELDSAEKRDIAHEYMSGSRTQDIIEKSVLSSRTVFRHVALTLESIYKSLVSLGFDYKYFCREYKGFSFLNYTREEECKTAVVLPVHSAAVRRGA